MGAMPDKIDYLKFESGQMTRAQEIDFFQRLVDSGELETLGSRYQIRAKTLIDDNEVFRE